MNEKLGLYVSVLPDGIIKRTLLSRSGKVNLDQTTINEEIITFSELVFLYYAKVVDTIILCANHVTEEGDPNFGGVNLDVFSFTMETVDDLVETLETENPIFGLLIRTELEDCLPQYENTPEFVFHCLDVTIAVLKESISFQFFVNALLQDIYHGVSLDFENQYHLVQEVAVQQVLSLGDKISSQYYFRSLIDYYRFLLIHFLERKPNVALCQCCGRYFIPRTKKKTLYCDRILKDNKTCKDLAPSLKHKLTVQNQKVIEEFDRAKRRMYKRYERSENRKQTPSDKDLSYADYYDWLDQATRVRDEYLNGKLSEEDALKAIVVP